MDATLEGYAKIEVSLECAQESIYVWVSLSGDEILDWGDGIEARTLAPIPWQELEQALSNAGTTFEREYKQSVLRQVQNFGLWQSLTPEGIALDVNASEPSRGPGVRKAQPRQEQATLRRQGGLG